jgi:hypothetical protein
MDLQSMQVPLPSSEDDQTQQLMRLAQTCAISISRYK